MLLPQPQPHPPGLPSGMWAKAPSCAFGERAALARTIRRGAVAYSEERLPAAGSGSAEQIAQKIGRMRSRGPAEQNSSLHAAAPQGKRPQTRRRGASDVGRSKRRLRTTLLRATRLVLRPLPLPAAADADARAEGEPCSRKRHVCQAAAAAMCTGQGRRGGGCLGRVPFDTPLGTSAAERCLAREQATAGPRAASEHLQEDQGCGA